MLLALISSGKSLLGISPILNFSTLDFGVMLYPNTNMFNQSIMTYVKPESVALASLVIAPIRTPLGGVCAEYVIGLLLGWLSTTIRLKGSWPPSGHSGWFFKDQTHHRTASC